MIGFCGGRPFFMTHHTLLNPPRANRWHILLLTVVLSPNVVHAGVFDTLINFLSPVYERLTNKQPTPINNNAQEVLSARPPTARPKVQRQDIISPDHISATNTPDLGSLLHAEFALERGNPAQALVRYKQEAMKDNATAVFERALSLSMQHEPPAKSLDFARQWQAKNPDHIPALFYVTHLALKADDYRLAASYLRQILTYDPNADLSQMFVGILPSSSHAQQSLLQELQALDAHQNPSLAVLKAGLLVQLGELSAAILYLDHALVYDQDNLAYLILKADILKMLDDNALLDFLSQATKTQQGDTQKQLLLYHVRHLIDHNQLPQAWHILDAHQTLVSSDTELLLLAGLLALDLDRFDDSRRYLNLLKQKPTYQGEADYYLGLSYERQGDFERALGHFSQVEDVQFVLPATQKQVAYELLFDRPEQAMTALVKLKQHSELFVSDSVMLQADILVRLKREDEAKALLLSTYQTYPDELDVLFAYIKLLDDQGEHTAKAAAWQTLLEHDGDNPTYLLNYANFLLAGDKDDPDAYAIIIRLSQDDDPNIRQQALLLLANHAQTHQDHERIVHHLKPFYDSNPTLAIGTALLRAYQALGDTQRVTALLGELTAQFGNTPTLTSTN